MTWSDIYLICFFTGFIFSLVSMLSGHVHLHFHHGGHGGGGAHGGGHGHTGGHGHGHGHGHGQAKSSVSPFNAGTGAAFLTWFGGAGYLATNYYRTWFGTALVIA